MPLLRSGLYRALLLLLPATRREVLAVPLEDCTGNLLPLWERDISREAVCWPGTASNICLCRVNPLKERHGERLAGLHIVRHLPEKDALPQQRISSCQVAATATGERWLKWAGNKGRTTELRIGVSCWLPSNSGISIAPTEVLTKRAQHAYRRSG